MNLIICFTLCFQLISFGQTKIEDLENKLKSLPEDRNRVDILSKLSFEIFTSSPEKAEQYALEAIELGRKLGYKKGVARAYSKLAISFQVRGNYTLAFENYQKALDLYREVDDLEGAAKIFNNLGILFIDQGNYQKSLEYYSNALKVFEEIGKKISAAGVLNNIGEIYEKLDKLDQALEYYDKSYKIFSSMQGFEREKAHILINKGRIHFNKGDMSFALKYYQQALYISLNFDEKSYVANCYKNIGEIYFSQKNFEKALEYLNKSLKIIEEIGDKHGIAVCFLSIGKIHGELRNALLSQSFNSKSLKIAREIGAKEIEMKALQNLSDQEFTLGNYAAALDYFKKHSVIKDTILGIETRKQIAEFQTKYDTEKKEQENIKLRMKNELQEQTIQKQIYASILVTVFLISAAILAIVFFRGQKKQKKVNLLLAQKNEEINSTLGKLRATQAQLVQSEKMASLGQLTAGIAHEINNPINFITTSLQGLQLNLKDLINLQKEYDDVSPDNAKEKMENISSIKKEMKYDILLSELGELPGNILDGANRAAEIVKGLRAFTRLDEVEQKTVNIHKGIDSTISILEHQIDEQIKVKKAYGDLPDIPCYPGKLNQVFMNVLTNAIESIKSKKELREESIIIKTSLEEKNGKEYAVIRISDTGPGLPENIKDKIFDPFYTTKDVGQGTGLGLSISLGIIKSHNGTIEVDSKPGEGTTFTIMIPIVQ